MNEKLELLSLAKKFIIRKEKNEYYIEVLNSNLGAVINEKNEISYCVTGCYDSGIDWISFDLKEFEDLKNFCELMIEKE